MKSRHAAVVAKIMLSLAVWLLAEEEVDIDLWSYAYYGGRPDVENLCTLL